jgi:hypothetical protein
MSKKVRWEGVGAMQKRMDAYERRMKEAVVRLARRWAPELENYAKRNHPWQNQTGNAGQGLHAWLDIMTDVIRLYLSHGVAYGLALETKYGGKYAIIWPTLEQHLPALAQSLERAFGRR